MARRAWRASRNEDALFAAQVPAVAFLDEEPSARQHMAAETLPRSPADAYRAYPRLPAPRTQGWQRQLWEYVYQVGELWNATWWQAASASRARIYVTELDKYGRPGEPTDNVRVLAAVAPLLSHVQQQNWLHDAAFNVALVGEAYLHGEDVEDEPTYEILSTEQVTAGVGDKIQITTDETGQQRPIDTNNETLVRIWRPDPRRPWEPTSPSRSTIGILCAIVKLTKLISSVADSRLSGPGLWIISNKIDPPPVNPKHVYTGNTTVDELIRLASIAINDPDSPAAHIPLILQGDTTNGEDLIQQINQSTDFPLLLTSILQLLIRRFALAMPMPPEIVLGTEDVSHWGQWWIEEAAAKATVAPLVEVIVAGLADQWLPAALRAAGINNPERWTLHYDLSALTRRPDRSDAAIRLFELEELSGKALRRELGFEESDRPTSENPGRVTDDDTPTGEMPSEGTSNRGTRELPPQTAPDDDETAGMSALVAAARTGGVAALARTGNWIRGQSTETRKRYADMPADRIHLCATEAERAACVPHFPPGVLDELAEVGSNAGYSRRAVESALTATVADAITHSRTFDPEAFIRHLGRSHDA